MQTFIVSAVSNKDWIAMEKAGDRVYKLPTNISKHFIAPLALKKGERVVAIHIDASMIDVCITMAAFIADREE